MEKRTIIHVGLRRKILFFGGSILFVLVALLLIAEIVKVSKEARYVGMENTQTNTITVDGTGEVSTVPNKATFSFSVQADGDTQASAQSAMATGANASIAFLTQNGVAQKDIQTSDYNVSQKYQNVSAGSTSGSSGSASAGACPANLPCPMPIQIINPATNQVADGFTASETINVTLHDLSNSGALLSGVANVGATNVSSLSFSNDNNDALTDQARAKAIADAKNKAQELASELGVQLVRIQSFSDNSGIEPMAFAKPFAVADTASAPVTPNIQTGQNTITSNVTITYEIR